MHIKRRFSIYFTMFLLTLVSVSAQGRSVGSALRQVMDIFSSLYKSVPSFFNAIIYIAILGYALEMSAKRVKGLGENSGKVSRVVALALGVSLAVFEARQGSNYLLAFGPYAFLLIMFIFGITIYHGLTGLSIESKRAIGFAYFFIFTIAQGAVPEYMGYVDREIPLLSAILWITYLISIFLMLWAIFSLLAGPASTLGGLAKGGNHPHPVRDHIQDHANQPHTPPGTTPHTPPGTPPHTPPGTPPGTTPPGTPPGAHTPPPGGTPTTPPSGGGAGTGTGSGTGGAGTTGTTGTGSGSTPPPNPAVNHLLTQVTDGLNAYIALANGEYKTLTDELLADTAAGRTFDPAKNTRRNAILDNLRRMKGEIDGFIRSLTAQILSMVGPQQHMVLKLSSDATAIFTHFQNEMFTEVMTRLAHAPPIGTPITPIPITSVPTP